MGIWLNFVILPVERVGALAVEGPNPRPHCSMNFSLLAPRSEFSPLHIALRTRFLVQTVLLMKGRESWKEYVRC